MTFHSSHFLKTARSHGLNFQVATVRKLVQSTFKLPVVDDDIYLIGYQQILLLLKQKLIQYSYKKNVSKIKRKHSSSQGIKGKK